METIHFEIPAPSPEHNPPPAARPTAGQPWVLVGVLASGNLEILVEPATGGGGHGSVDVETSAVGFGPVWRAVLEDFTRRHGPALVGLRLTVHDAGATPAVVSLRLDQALEEFRHPPGEGDSL